MRCSTYVLSSKRIIQPTAPSGIPLRRILQPVFPLSVSNSIQQWTKRNQLREAEQALLNCVGLCPSNAVSPFTVRSLDIPVEVVQNSTRTNGPFTMNELEIKSANFSSDRHIVFVHGYGASKGYFYRNFKQLAKSGTVHALDWLGYGLSSRPTPRLPKFDKLSQGVHYGEDWFLKPFESWRKKRGIEKFTFVAHSLGAYLACAYASKYPDFVEKLVLVSPASVNRTAASIPGADLYPSLRDAERAAILSPVTSKIPKAPRWFKHLWERHWSPFSLVRRAGPWGPKLTSGWTSRRFAQLPSTEQLALQDYSYRMFNARGSGEYLLNYFLAVGGVGRWPLAERLQGLRCPSLWMYGDHDWMDYNGGKEAVRRLRLNNLDAQLVIIPNSGHHLYLDNQQSFNNSIAHFI